ncbi:hypothetical protein [Ensifer adhaerens]|uniref:hypothetical protein n=1 Tax=Ensifer adhaerens TaxID=106592 RepID=UPI001319E351|nr:hypothetical protein [Ensifer adhaerens]
MPGPSYFVLDPTTGKYSVSKRPTNQNGAKVVRKTSAYIQARIPAHLRKRQVQNFLGGVSSNVSLSKMASISKKGIDMAHVISANELGYILNLALQAGKDAKNAAARRVVKSYLKTFLDTIVSSDEDIATMTKRHDDIDAMFPNNFSLPMDARAASRLFARINRTSRNLFGGDAIINRKIQQHRDIPRQSDGTDIPYVRLRVAAADTYYASMKTTAPTNYLPLSDTTTGMELSSTQ